MSNPLEGYSVEQLRDMLASAQRAEARGARILGPGSITEISIELNRRGALGTGGAVPLTGTNDAGQLVMRRLPGPGEDAIFGAAVEPPEDDEEGGEE